MGREGTGEEGNDTSLRIPLYDSDLCKSVPIIHTQIYDETNKNRQKHLSQMQKTQMSPSIVQMNNIIILNDRKTEHKYQIIFSSFVFQ